MWVLNRNLKKRPNSYASSFDDFRVKFKSKCKQSIKNKLTNPLQFTNLIYTFCSKN